MLHNRHSHQELLDMPAVRWIVVWLVCGLLMIVSTACQSASANEMSTASDNQALVAVSATPTSQPSDNVVWGKVPYCNCLADSATTNVANALKKANLTVKLKEQSPRDGWLYFVATFDSTSTTREKVSAAMIAGGAEVLAGPP